MMKTNKQIENCLTSDLSNFLNEINPEGEDKKQLLLEYFSSFMESANVDTDITIAVLEKFGEEGKEEARNLKVKWGY